ncbi:hypothetical protein KUTeg_011341 [Tegillarca granosa]|uniref:WSC domain-containing protein n=1 Tax=Tegillarca granosa TaxID=220873 RepID=A0ABQ9F135_TEGGR|nr:hypothetical protein KUTeg_011341 [Tegillarca granosa]
MLCGKKYIIVACIIFLHTAPRTAETASYRYYNEKLPWLQALKKCRDINGSLFDLSDIKSLQKSCTGYATGDIWSGHYHSLSHWLEFVGCYTELNRPKLERKSMTTSDPLECQHLCQNSTYFGLYKGDICICFGSDNYVLGNKLEADAQHCHIRCTNRTSIFCGGQKAVSVYRTVSKTFSDKPGHDCIKEDCNCVAAECKHSGLTMKKEFYKQPCSSDLATVCTTNNLQTKNDACQKITTLLEQPKEQQRPGLFYKNKPSIY